MKQKKCPYCSEKVYEVFMDGKKLITEIYTEGGDQHQQWYFMKHTCKVPKRLRK